MSATSIKCAWLIGIATLWSAAATQSAAVTAEATPVLSKSTAMPLQTLVGDPHHPEALAQSIQAAYDAGARQIAIRPGVYRMPALGHASITLNGWRDATLSGLGATLILTDNDSADRGIDVLSCTRVTVSGLLLSQNLVTAYQGRVIAIGSDPDGRRNCDWRPDTGYPIPPNVEKGFLGGDVNIVDKNTRLLKVGCGDYYGVKDEPNGDGTFHAHMGGNIAVGDWLVGRYGDAPFKIYLTNSRDCTIQNVTMTRNGFAPLREDGGGGNRYLRITWALGPRPDGATEKPLVTNAADGMHMTGSYPGPDIEDCSFQGVFLDDCIAIHGFFQAIQSASGNMLTLQGGVGAVNAGQPVRICDQKGYVRDAMVTAVSDDGNNTTIVTLDKDYSVPPNCKLSNPLTSGAGYKIIRCHLGDTRSRGILAKADDGLIQGNVLENCGMSAVSLGPEYYWNEAGYVRNVRVVNNVFRHDGGAGNGGAAILVHGEGTIGNENIVIQGNRMTGDYQGDIDLQWASGVTLTGNVLTAPPEWLSGAKPYSPINLANCEGVILNGNVVRNAAHYDAKLIAVGPAVTALENDDPAGIRKAAPTAY